MKIMLLSHFPCHICSNHWQIFLHNLLAQNVSVNNLAGNWKIDNGFTGITQWYNLCGTTKRSSGIKKCTQIYLNVLLYIYFLYCFYSTTRMIIHRMSTVQGNRRDDEIEKVLNLLYFHYRWTVSCMHACFSHSQIPRTLSLRLAVVL